MPKEKLEGPKFEEALFRSLHRYQDAEKRWRARCKTGLTDAELKGAIADEYGISGSSSGPKMPQENHKGGKNPCFWIGETYPQPKVTLHGKKLVRTVRALLKIPDKSGQQNLFK